MKYGIYFFLATLITTSAIASENLGLDPKLGTLSGHVQTLSMWRDYDQSDPKSAYSHSLGLQLDYTSPEIAGLMAKLSYVGVGVLDAQDMEASDPGASRVLNGRVNVLNEAYLQYRFSSISASNTTVSIGRKAHNGEVFRYDAFRQKIRALEGVFIDTKDIPHFQIMGGHAWRLSNVYGIENTKLGAEFDEFGDVLAAGANDSDGVTWAEVLFKGVKNVDVAVFNALAWDVVNVSGARAKLSISENTAFEASYRSETDDGKAEEHSADAYSLALLQKLGNVSLEGGYFSVHGDNLIFEENTTGVNHALGSSLMIATAHFAGGADTAYLKAVTKINKTVLYCLANSTWHDKLADVDHAQEINIVIKQPLTDSLTMALKGGAAQINKKTGSDENRLDGRIFMTYNF